MNRREDLAPPSGRRFILGLGVGVGGWGTASRCEQLRNLEFSNATRTGRAFIRFPRQMASVSLSCPPFSSGRPCPSAHCASQPGGWAGRAGHSVGRSDDLGSVFVRPLSVAAAATEMAPLEGRGHERKDGPARTLGLSLAEGFR